MVKKMTKYDPIKYQNSDPRCNPHIDAAMQKALTLFGITDIQLSVERCIADYDGLDEGKPILIEAEYANHWKHGEYPYESMSVFGRYLPRNHTQLAIQMETPCYHMWISADLERAIMVTWTDIRNYGQLGQHFNDRGLQDCIYVNLKYFEKCYLLEQRVVGLGEDE